MSDDVPGEEEFTFDMQEFDEIEAQVQEVDVADDSDALVATRRHDITRSVHAFLLFHSGCFSEFGYDQDRVDEVGQATIQRMHEEGQLEHESAYETRVSATQSLRTQLGTDITPTPLRFDVGAIASGYNLPGAEAIPEVFLRNLQNNLQGEVGCAFHSWAEYCNFYRSFASYLVYDLDLVLDILETHLPHYMRFSDFDWDARMMNRHYRQPSIEVLGVAEDRNRTVGEAVTSRELARLVRVHGQITMLSPSKTQFLEAAFQCARCENPETNYVAQNAYDDELLYPLPCSVPGHAHWTLLDPPESRVITIRRALIQDPLVQTSDTPVMMVEFRQELSEMISPGEDVVLVGYVRSRPIGKQGKRDRNREVFMVVTGIESNRVQSDISVSESEREAVNDWAGSRSFEEKVDALVSAFAPHIKGRDNVKKALLCQQVGGSARDGVRSDIHILMGGDPGTGKTEMARWAYGLSPASRYISAERATIPGMIGGISNKEEMFSSGDKRVIEPGVLASVGPGGLAVIDEAHFLDRKGQDISTQLNTALETQEVPIALMGGGTVRTKTPVLLAANPKKGDNTKFDPDSHLTYAAQMGIAESTMSRIDAVIIMRDILQNEEKEIERAVSALERLTGGSEEEEESDVLPHRFTQCYFALAREIERVRMPREVVRFIAMNQVKARNEALDGDVVSNRRINSIGRFACAAAKLDLCDTVTMEHAQFAIDVMRNTLMDESPAAAEGGKTSQQMGTEESIWQCLVAMHTELLEDSYSMGDIVTHVRGEIDSVKEASVRSAVTGFVANGKRHSRWGGFIKQGGRYGFEN